MLIVLIDRLFSFHYQALVYCNESCYFAITWGLHYLTNNAEPQAQEEISVTLQRNLYKYMNVCTDLVQQSKVIDIQEAAFKSICDLLITFSDQLGLINPVCRKLHYVSNADQQAVLNGFVQQHVFAIQEEGLYPEHSIIRGKRALLTVHLSHQTHYRKPRRNQNRRATQET